MPENELRAVGNYPQPKSYYRGQVNPYLQDLKVNLPISIRAKGLLECCKVENGTKQRHHIISADLFQIWKVQRQQLCQSVNWLIHCANSHPELGQTISGFLDEQLQPRQYLTTQLVNLLSRLPY